VCSRRHTNYLAYVKEGQATGFLNAAAVYRVNRWVCRIHCDKVVKLSDAVQKLPHQVGVCIAVERVIVLITVSQVFRIARYSAGAMWGVL
jgi:hypothetical protein